MKKKRPKQKEKSFKEMRDFIKKQAEKALRENDKEAFQIFEPLSQREREFTFLVGELNAYLG